jgi:hypothetical protein
VTEQAFYSQNQLGWRDRLMYRLFPHRHCKLPEAPATFKDVLCVDVNIGISWGDLARLVVTRKLSVRTRVVCEHKIGATVSGSVSFPVARFD